MKSIVRAGAVSALLASSMFMTVPMANADPLELSATLSIGSMEMISNLPYYGYYGYYPYYWGYGNVPGLAITEGADVANNAISAIPNIIGNVLPW
ncbi:hypothetical protein [Hoyosella altamirensis]|uniref:Uncharacterized protein n=1 Tax=Hoyosella altamirensis TaxID=616997 RepID=A0A839RJV9_9ACTN|nr:hypothetical protein [Hoyosella altamirensis]MBB3036589.1 hypothetical protein [Hoyosella altamirensis]